HTRFSRDWSSDVCSSDLGSQSGKSTLIRTLIAALALTHTPAEAQFYCLDFGGGGLSQLASLPHVGGVAARLNPERVHRAVAEVKIGRASCRGRVQSCVGG